MSVLSDFEIRERSNKNGMIQPFVEKLVRTDKNKNVLSYGLSSYGYDVRVSNEFKIFTNINNSIIDNLRDKCKFIYNNNKIYKYDIENIKIVVNHIDFIKGNRVFKKVIEIDLKSYETWWEIQVYTIEEKKIIVEELDYSFTDYTLVFNKTFYYNEKAIILPFDNIIEILKKIFLEVCNEK